MTFIDELVRKYQSASIDDIRRVIQSACMPSLAEQRALDGLDTLAVLEHGSSEYADILKYVASLTALPWNRKTGIQPERERLEEFFLQHISFEPSKAVKIRNGLTSLLIKKFHKSRILVVDDEKIALTSLGRALTKEGYSVVTACNGAEAIDELKKSGFDVVITDLIMGDVDGYAVLEETKRRYPEAKLIMITGYATVDTAVQAIRMGAFHYIEKPLKLDEVRSTVREALGSNVSTGREAALCFAGSSEPEKTELPHVIAEGLGRKVVNVSLTDIKNSFDVRGRDKSNEGGTPGCIIEGICCADAADPVFVLDGLDQVSPDFEAEVFSVLTEIIDPVKSKSYIDRYINVPFDLSDVMYIIITDSVDRIKSPLRELLEIVEF